jgi:LPXTG-motif cell wall-anchored protein
MSMRTSVPSSGAPRRARPRARHLAAAVAAASVVVGASAVAPAGALVPGEHWVPHSTGTTVDTPVFMAYGAGRFVTFTGIDGPPLQSTAMTSIDGVTWEPLELPAPARTQRWFDAVYAVGTFVAVAATPSTSTGDEVMTSPDGLHWTYRRSPIGLWTSITYGDGRFVAVGNASSAQSSGQPIVMTSPDGIDWTAQTTPDDTTQLNGVGYANGTFVADAFAPGRKGFAMMTSPDGISWTLRPSPPMPPNTSFGSQFPTFGNGTWVEIIGSNPGQHQGYVLWSRDNGATWTLGHAASAAQWADVVFTGSNFVADAQTGGDDDSHLVMTSPDGVHWTSQSSPAVGAAHYGWYPMAIGAGKVVAVTWDGAYAMTTDVAPPLPASGLSAVVQSDQAIVSWSPSPSEGSSTITSYTTTAVPGGASCTTTSTSCAITGLSPGSTYSISVVATNDAGTSSPSASLSVSVPTTTTTATTTTSSVGPAPLAATGSDLASPWLIGTGLTSLLGGTFLLLRRRRSARRT